MEYFQNSLILLVNFSCRCTIAQQPKLTLTQPIRLEHYNALWHYRHTDSTPRNSVSTVSCREGDQAKAICLNCIHADLSYLLPITCILPSIHFPVVPSDLFLHLLTPQAHWHSFPSLAVRGTESCERAWERGWSNVLSSTDYYQCSGHE